MRSQIEAHIKTVVSLKLTEASHYKIPVACKITIKSIHGTMRIQYSKDPNRGSWFCFVGRPAIKFNIDPVIGEQESQLEVKNIPKLREFLENQIEKVFDEFCLPNRKPMNIPVTILEEVNWPRKK